MRHIGTDPAQFGWSHSTGSDGVLVADGAWNKRSLSLAWGRGVERSIAPSGGYISVGARVYIPAGKSAGVLGLELEFKNGANLFTCRINSSEASIGSSTYTMLSGETDTWIRVVFGITYGVNNAQADLWIEGKHVIQSAVIQNYTVTPNVFKVYHEDVGGTNYLVDAIDISDNRQSFETLTGTQAAYDKLVLAQIFAGYDVAGDLAVAGGLSDTLSASFASYQNTHVSRVYVNGVEFTECESAAEVENNSTGYYYDGTTLYIYGTSIPEVAVAEFPLFFSNAGLRYNSFYDPLIISAPAATLGSNDVFWGFSQSNSTALTLANPDDYFNTIFSTYVWENRQIRFLIGSSDLPFSEFKPIFTGVIKNKTHSRGAVSFTTTDEKKILETQIPTTFFDKDDYSSLPSSNIGRVIPLLYGEFVGERGVPGVCVDEAVSSSGGELESRWQLCASSCLPLQEIDKDDCSYWDGSVWRALDVQTASVGGGFIDVGFYSSTILNKDTAVRFHVKGRLDYSGLSTLEYGPDMVETFFVNVLGRGDQIESGTMKVAKNAASLPMAFYIGEQINLGEAIRSIAQSEAAQWLTDGEGLLNYRIWEPQYSESLPSYDETDYFNFATNTDESLIGRYTRVGHGRHWTGERSYTWNPASTPTDDVTKWKYDVDEPQQFETLLRTSSASEILKQRYDLIYRNPTRVVSMGGKWKMARHLPYDKVKLNHSAGPDQSGSMVNAIFEVTNVAIDGAGNARLVLTDLKGVGDSIGYWTSSNAPDFVTATAEEKKQSGFWCNSNGEAISGNASTKNVSKWW